MKVQQPEMIGQLMCFNQLIAPIQFSRSPAASAAYFCQTCFRASHFNQCNVEVKTQ